MKWICQAYRGMDKYKSEIEIEAESYEEAMKKAILHVPFGDIMSCNCEKENETEGKE